MDTVNVKPLRYAIIKPRTTDRNYGHPPNELTFVPDTAPMQDIPSGTGKGHTLKVESNWLRYIKAINPMPGAYGWVIEPHAMWCNISTDTDDTLFAPITCESINVGCNIVAYTSETNSHIKLLSRSLNFDTSRLNPTIDNWYNFPYLFFKAQAISKDGRFTKVGNALDAYIPILHNTELWMSKTMVELFPAGPAYRFNGINIYDGATPLRVNGVNYNGFNLSTPSLIPPANWQY